MSANLVIGDEVVISTSGRKTVHAVVARRADAGMRSGVAYRLMPAAEPEWIDADKVGKAHGFERAADEWQEPFPEAIA